jgi:C-terminal processing protease CtpA/Prc
LKIKEKFQTTGGYPKKEERILALAKLYAVMTYFSPHQNLMKVTPEENFKQIFPQIIAAKDSLEYNLALAQFVSNLADSHGFVLSRAYTDMFFSGSFPFHLKKIDDKFIVSKIYDEKWKTEKNISIGDEILAMNDESLGSIFEKARKYFSSSNENGENYNVTNWMLNGNLDETFTLDIKSQENTKSVLAQRIQFGEVSQKKSAIKDTIRFFENIAYVNLAWLQQDKIQSMFSEIKESEALIFDMRGYPKMIIWELSKYLIDEKKLNAYYQIPIFDCNYFMYEQGLSLLTTKQFTDGIEKKYTNPIVVLMDESTVSQAEYTCSVIKELTGATLIGRQTAGADGDITYIALPGNVYVTFTGMNAMNARQISEQGIGLLPDIEVEYTLEGIREERDEILEKALEYLRNRLENRK